MLRPGEILNNRYQLGQKIGDGGSAQVFVAHDLMLGRTVAVKILDTDFSNERGSFKRFQIEARAIAALDHPNIIAVHDFGMLEAEQSAYLVMPYVSGGPLSTRLKVGRLSLDEAAIVLEQLASGLDYAHQQGIVHRDVKPSNVLMRPNNQIVLTDFGFAKITDDADRVTHTQSLGTIEYIAPEQIFGLVSAASDQYSLGILLYQMVAGVLPFQGHQQAILVGHTEKSHPTLALQPSMQNVPSDVVARLDRIMIRVLAKSASQRYPNCGELSRAFRQAIQTDPRIEVAATLTVEATEPAVSRARLGSNPLKISELEMAAMEKMATTQMPARTLIKPAQLVVTVTPDQTLNKVFDLNATILKLGRGQENELYLPLPTISRYHATLHRFEGSGGYRIVDNQSRNGLLFKGKFIKEKVLEDGDVIEIGKIGVSDYVVTLLYNAPIYR